MAHGETNAVETAVEILSDLLSQLENVYEYRKEKYAEHRIAVMTNLSKYYGISGKYKESIKLCDRTIALMKKADSGSPYKLATLIFNKGCCYAELIESSVTKEKKAKDRSMAKKLLTTSYLMFEEFDYSDTMTLVKNYAKDKLGLDLE